MKIRCSGLARPMVCAGYVFLDLPRSGTNEAAEQGTAAGEYLERLLLNKPIGTVASNGYYFEDDMKFYTTPIYEDMKERAASEILCEQKIDWQTKSGIWIKGQYDAAFVDTNGRLCIEDLKYGWGIVEVEENWQLLGYAIGEVIRRGQAFNEISLKIHQPRAHHEDGSSREWLLTYSELLSYKEKIETRMQEIADGRKDLQTSSKCKYCMGAAEACPAFNRLFHRSLEVSTEFFQDSINDDELSRQLDQIKRAEEAIKIKKDSLTELGVLRIKKGGIIPGYVQTDKFSNRAWKKGISPDAIKMMTGKDVVEKNFMTPAKAEKLGVSKELVKQLTEKRLVGVKLEKKDNKIIGNNIFGTNNPNGGK
jgi:hypothetical protein